ncbi:MAG TPA: AI-2E family transporter [Chloroflexota bacterium]
MPASPTPAADRAAARPSIGWVLLGLFVFLYAIREILPPFVLAAVIAYIVFPPVAALERRLRWPRALIVLVCYVVLVAVLVGTGYALIPRLVAQAGALREAGPKIVADTLEQLVGSDRIDVLGQSFGADDIVQRLAAEVTDRVSGGGRLAELAGMALHYLLALLVFFVALFYLLLDGPAVVSYPLGFLGPRRAAAEALVARVNRAWGRYVRGQLFLVVLMSFVSWVVLEFVFRLPYAFTLGVTTGFLEIIPLLGPLLAGAIACSVALAHSGPLAAVWLAAAYFVLRQLEDQIVMPLVVGRAVHLAPIVTLFSVLAGERLAGPLGMLLAIPVAAAAKVLLDEWRAHAEADRAEPARGQG